MKRNGMEPIRARTNIKFSFFTSTNIITHHTLKMLTLDFVFLPTDLLETLFLLISIKSSPRNLYLIPTVTHVLAFIQANHRAELFLVTPTGKLLWYFGVVACIQAF